MGGGVGGAAGEGARRRGGGGLGEGDRARWHPAAWAIRAVTCSGGVEPVPANHTQRPSIERGGGSCSGASSALWRRASFGEGPTKWMPCRVQAERRTVDWGKPPVPVSAA